MLFGHKDSFFYCLLSPLLIYAIMGSNLLDMHMLLSVYLEYLFQWVIDMGQSLLLCLFDLVDWHLTKVVAFDMGTLTLCLDLALYVLTIFLYKSFRLLFI